MSMIEFCILYTPCSLQTESFFYFSDVCLLPFRTTKGRPYNYTPYSHTKSRSFERLSACRKGSFRHAGQTVEKASGFRFVGFVAVQRYGRVRQSGKQLKMPVFAGIFSYCFAVDTAYFFIDYYSIAVVALYRQSESRSFERLFI